MEVMTSSPAAEFNFDSACTSPYITAPSSPTRFGAPFFSAPTSPTRASSFYNAFNTSLHGSEHGGGHGGGHGGHSLSSIPFNWEEKPGTPKNSQNHNDENTDFAFDFSGELERKSLPADELFHGGKIKLLKPPPRFHYENKPETSRSPKKSFKEAFSPRFKKKEPDPFAAAIEITQSDDKIETIHNTIQESNKNHVHERGRERNPISSNPVKGHKTTRSLSPLRASDLLFDKENEQQKPNKTSFSLSWYKNWKIKDLLLFRSASEGHATNMYGVIKKKNNDNHEDCESFRSIDSSGSSVSSSRRRSISAHEVHYTINRAVSEEMKKKTFLPYKQGLLGCLGFNPAVKEISKGIGSMRGG